MGMYLLYICIGDFKHLPQKCSKQLSWQGFAVTPSEKEGKPRWESIPVLSTLLAKGTQTPLALNPERREDAKEDASTTKVNADGSQLLLDLNIGLLFEKVSYVGYWKKNNHQKTPLKPPTHPQNLSFAAVTWKLLCWDRPATEPGTARMGPSCGGKFCHGAPKMSLICFHLLVKNPENS